MSRTYTRTEMKKIIEEHALRYDGVVNERCFLEEARDPSHPAHEWSGWCDWDKDRLSEIALVEAARRFVSVRIESTTYMTGPINARVRLEAPMTVAPLTSGGTHSPDRILTASRRGMAEYRRHAKAGSYGLQHWFSKFGPVLTQQERALAEQLLALL